MAVVRKILIFIVLTAGIIALGRLAAKLFPKHPPAAAASRPSGLSGPTAIIATAASDGAGARDSTNALPAAQEDTTGGRWHEKLFAPLLRAYALDAKSLKQKRGFWEIVFPKGNPIHEYALQIETLCRANGITVEQGAELHPANRSIEYMLVSNGQRIKLRASLGAGFMAGSAKLAVVFIDLDSLNETQLAELESAPWDKTLAVDPYDGNPVLKKLRFTDARNEVLCDLPMEPSNYPYVDPGKHALFIHLNRDDVERILGEALDSLPKAAGFASRYGDRAIENQPLLEKLFRYTALHRKLFLDLTGSPRSLARQSAAGQGAHSRSVAAFKEGRMEDELARKASLAQKTGDAVLVLPYSEAGFRRLAKALEADAARFNQMGVELVSLSALMEASQDTSVAPAAGKTAAANGPSAKTGAAASKASAGKSVAGKAPGKSNAAKGAADIAHASSRGAVASAGHGAVATAGAHAKTPAASPAKHPADPHASASRSADARATANAHASAGKAKPARKAPSDSSASNRSR